MRSRAGPGGAQPVSPCESGHAGPRTAVQGAQGAGEEGRAAVRLAHTPWACSSAAERPGCHGTASTHSLPAAPAPSWDNQKCLQMKGPWTRTLFCTRPLSSCVEDRGEGVQPGGTATVQTGQGPGPAWQLALLTE